MISILKKPATPLILMAVVAVVVAAPGFVLAYALIGGNLGMGTSGNGFQRDFRVYNNSTDAVSNDNTTTEAAYPGALGAVMAVWKAAKGWTSDNSLAGKNFDFDFQGTNTSNPSNANTVGWDSVGCGGGTLAYCETPIDNGWRIVMCDGYDWDDGPGAPGGNDWDIQGIATHELGHALGLGHSQGSNCGGACSSNSTMCAFVCFDGESERTITADDAAGVEAVYGLIPATKPLITGLTGSFLTGGTLFVNGSNFGTTAVNVKFTAGTGLNTGTIPGTVYNVTPTAAGTQISVVIPATAQDGNVHVWKPGAVLMSNAFPIDIGYIPPLPPAVTSFFPATVAAFQGGGVTVTGTGFSGVTQMTVGGVVRTPPAGFQILSDTTITFVPGNASALGPVPVTVTAPGGTSAPMSFDYIATSPPKLVTPALAFSNTAFSWDWGAGAYDLGALLVSLDPTTFDFGTPYQILLYGTLLGIVPTSAGGIGNAGVTIPPGLGGIHFYSQIGAVDEITTAFAMSNVTTTLILF